MPSLVKVTCTGKSPISFSRHVSLPKKNKESSEDYEARTWRERCHVNENGLVIIPPMMTKNALAESGKYLGMQIIGRGKSTYTKHIEAGVLITEPSMLYSKEHPKGVPHDSVVGEWFHVPSDGKRGGDKRVMKCFPRVDNWWYEVDIQIIDDIITKDVFMEHLKTAGLFIGIGRFRPRNNGFYGRFDPEIIEWKEVSINNM